jgi:hypothetical protein
MIAQELFDAIVNEIAPGDNECLKACSLAAWALRDSSQRILFRSLTLKCDTTGPNYQTACARLSESPRIAGYIAWLNIILPNASLRDATAVPQFSEVLEKLPNVRRCDIVGRHAAFPWYEHAPGLESAITHFVGHQRLLEVHISRLNLRSHLLSMLVSRVPTLTLDGCFAPTPSTLPKFHVSPAHRRILQTDSDDVCDFLAHPHFAAYSTTLTCLVVPLHSGHVSTLLLTTAPNLEHVRFHCSGK